VRERGGYERRLVDHTRRVNKPKAVLQRLHDGAEASGTHAARAAMLATGSPPNDAIVGVGFLTNY
jgi:hypothetical protein